MTITDAPTSTTAPHPLLSAGVWQQGSGEQPLAVENPATGAIAATVHRASLRDVERATRAAAQAQRAWASTPAAARGAVLLRLAEPLAIPIEQLGRILVAEVGKPVVEARGEVGGAIGFCRFAAGLAPVLGGEVLPSNGPEQELWLRREPIGVVGAIIPWNFPLALSARKAAPALVAGNAVVLKPSELTPLSALAFAELALEAGLPPALISVLPGPGAELGQAIVRDERIGLVTMTGSVRAGRSILAAAAERILPVSLELGGKAPFIVFDDADLDRAVADALDTRMMNNGQACVANERTYVHEGVYEDFVRAYTEATAALAVGDPSLESTRVGPKVSRPELENVERLVDAALAAGAVATTGGGRATVPGLEGGHWFTPTVLTGVPAGAAVLREEVFGPVTPILPFRDEEEVLGLANDSDFGLSAYLHTNDFRRVMRLSRALESGEVFVNRGGPEEGNGFHHGWGLSGLGGDDGTRGLELYTRSKAVYVDWRR